LARRLRQVHRRIHRKMGQSDPGRQHQGGVIRRDPGRIFRNVRSANARPPVTQTGRARSSHLWLSWRREHGRGTTGSSSMPGFTAPNTAQLATARSWRGIVAFTHLAREGRMTVTIGRRELLAALGGAAVAWPHAARAQQGGRLPLVAVLMPYAESD